MTGNDHDTGRRNCTDSELEEFFFFVADRFAVTLNASWHRYAISTALGLSGSSYVPDFVYAEMNWDDACERLRFNDRRAYALYRLFRTWSIRHQGQNFPVAAHMGAILRYLRPDETPSEGGAA